MPKNPGWEGVAGGFLDRRFANQGSDSSAHLGGGFRVVDESVLCQEGNPLEVERIAGGGRRR